MSRESGVARAVCCATTTRERAVRRDAPRGGLRLPFGARGLLRARFCFARACIGDVQLLWPFEWPFAVIMASWPVAS